jgi:hypothetical protein
MAVELNCKLSNRPHTYRTEATCRCQKFVGFRKRIRDISFFA